MNATNPNTDGIAKTQWAANDPILCEMTGIQFKGFVKGVDLFNNPVEGFPGMAWFPPNKVLLCRDLRIWPHPSRPRVILMEPLPQNVHHLEWIEIAVGDSSEGLGLYYRGWIKMNFAESKFERCDPEICGPSKDGAFMFGLPLEV